jgi:hypothetical protein
LMLSSFRFSFSSPLCPYRCQRMLVAQRARTLPGRLSQHPRLLLLQLRGYAWNSIGSRRTFVRRYRRMSRRQWRVLPLVPQHPGHGLLCLSRRLHAHR